MKFALRAFLTPNPKDPFFDHADPRQTVLREIDRTSGGFEPPKSLVWNGKGYGSE
jgi:hypothetical protein